jgi:hypothetical protein
MEMAEHDVSRRTACCLADERSAPGPDQSREHEHRQAGLRIVSDAQWLAAHSRLATPPIDVNARRQSLQTALTQALAEGGNVATLVQAIRDQERRQQMIRAELADLEMLRKLVEGRIVFTPDREARRYTFRVPGTLANFFSGTVRPQTVASPTGGILEWTREVPGDVPAASASKAAALRVSIMADRALLPRRRP